jgi:hypothetical protein
MEDLKDSLIERGFAQNRSTQGEIPAFGVRHRILASCV